MYNITQNFISQLTSKSDADKMTSRLAEILNEREQTCYDRLAISKKPDWLAGRISLKLAFKNFLNVSDLTIIEITNKDSGQPYLRHRPDISCSLSHSYGWGAGIASIFTVGIDLEKIRPHDPSLLAHITTHKEKELLSDMRLPANEKVTFVWCAKEAVMKAVGQGLGIPPRSVILEQIEHNENRVTASVFLKSQESYWNIRARFDRGFCLATATSKL